VTRIDRGGAHFVTALAAYLDQQGGQLALSHAELLESEAESISFGDLDAALEWCERELLERIGVSQTVDEVHLAEHELLCELQPDELERLVPSLGVFAVPAGSLLVRRGEAAAEIFLVTRGTLSVVAGGESGPNMRLATVSAGMTVGEVAYVTSGSRSADVRADSDVECFTLPYATIETLAHDDPVLHGKLLHGLIRIVVTRLLAADSAIGELAR
jgi:CRP-like cAMP-binding protein